MKELEIHEQFMITIILILATLALTIILTGCTPIEPNRTLINDSITIPVCNSTDIVILKITHYNDTTIEIDKECIQK